jgi:hypothetical protein
VVRRFVLALALLGALHTPHALAQPVLLAIPNPLQPEPPYFTQFGDAIGSVGSDVLVGDPYADAVYLFSGSTGALLRTFTAPNADSGFGHSVAGLGPNVLVGAPLDDTGATDAGRAYLFDASTGALLQTFVNPTPETSDEFGYDVAAVGSNALVSAPWGPQAGKAYLFDASTAALLQTFDNPGSFAGFGAAVAAVAGNVLVGAPSGQNTSGGAYLLDASNGMVLQTFVNPFPETDGFGFSVAALGTNVLVGAWISCCDVNPAAYLFDAATGALLQTFSVTGNGASSVAAVGGNAVVAGSDRVHLFDPATGSQLRVLDDPTGGGFTYVTRVAALGNKVLVGASNEQFHDRYGAVYGFCGGTTECGPCETCDASGACVAAPHPTCRAPVSGQSTLVLKDKSPNSGDRLLWKFAGTFPDPPRENPGTVFGFPSSSFRTDDYTLCLYDESTPTPSVLFQATAPAASDCGGNPCWREVSLSQGGNIQGYRYVDGDQTPHGLDNILVRMQTTGATRMKVRGKGDNLSNAPLGMPSPSLNLPLRLQLQIRGGHCWEATYPAARANVTGLFRAKSDAP